MDRCNESCLSSRSTCGTKILMLDITHKLFGLFFIPVMLIGTIDF